MCLGCCGCTLRTVLGCSYGTSWRKAPSRQQESSHPLEMCSFGSWSLACGLLFHDIWDFPHSCIILLTGREEWCISRSGWIFFFYNFFIVVSVLWFRVSFFLLNMSTFLFPVCILFCWMSVTSFMNCWSTDVWFFFYF